jgi:putative peptidoglycan lipid II flippase
VKIASPTFYALRDARTPVAVGIVAIVLNVILNVLLVRSLSFSGLALGTGVAALANAGILFWLLRRRLGGLDDRRVMTSLAKIVAASVVMAAVANTIEHQLVLHWGGTQVGRRAIRVGLAIGGGLATLALTARLLRLEEFEMAFGRIWRKVGGRFGRRRGQIPS